MKKRRGATFARWLLIGLAAVMGVHESKAQTAASPRAVIDRYCVGCHNDKAKVGGLALNTLNPESPGEKPDVWEKVVRKLSVRYMPPPGAPQPDAQTYDNLISQLQSSLDRAAAVRPNPGRTETFRRLNRTEYQNSIRDLLAVELDVSSLLPKDDSSHGFDNVTVGELSPTLLERYLGAARKLSRLAVGIPVKAPGGDTIVIPADRTQEDQFEELPFGTRGGGLARYTFPADGEYEIQLRLTRDRNERVEGLTEPHQVEIGVDGARVQLFALKPPAGAKEHESVDAPLHVRTPVNAGPHAITATFLRKSSALIETERQPYLARFNMDRHPRSQPALYSISITGPFQTTGAGDTPSRRRIFSCQPQKASEEDACAQRILSSLGRRAFRRPVSPADLQVLTKFYKEGKASGGFESGIEMALRAILTSPNFLFRIEREPANAAPDTVYRVSDLDLASRLSFFVWSSIPDDELLDLAIQGKLRQPAVLERQVRRMLADNRSESLVNNFAGQWLYLRNLDTSTPDARLFPDFDDNLRQSMRRETELFFDSILRDDRNVLDLLRANYTFLNERLAKHYGVPDVYGTRFRRVEFSGGDVRGGLIGQGSILTISSYGNRTSPVLRGKWILSNFLGSPPTPPPPNVPLLREREEGSKPLSLRERLAEHRNNAVCSTCHRVIDPPGFALENYDAVGRWRTNDNGAAIDASGSLPGGAPFQGPHGLRDALLQRPELFVSTVTEKLLTYALGRGLESYDAPAVRKIVRDSGSQDYRFSSLVLGIVNSTPFEMRRTQ
jgi:mono/diheme cytochrome c family protein